MLFLRLRLSLALGEWQIACSLDATQRINLE
jgi:hypothetical protein